MQVKRARVYRYPKGYLNDPNLIVEVDKIPAHEELRYKAIRVRDEGTLYYAEKDGYVNFMFHDPRREQGYGGRVFEITLENGEKRAIKGPWSSRAGVVNALGLGPCMEVSICEEGDGAFDRYAGNTAYSSGRGVLRAGALTIELAKKAAELAGVELECVCKYDEEPVWRVR